jgi:phosphotransferase system HPr (HPr) family protein
MAFIKGFKSEVLLRTNEAEVKCNSILNLLYAAIKQGTTVEVLVRGEDEEEAIPKIIDFLENLTE